MRFQKTKLFRTLGEALMVSFVFLLVLHQIAGGGAADNATGWAWSDTVGWISVNSTNDFGFRIQASSDDAYDAPAVGWPDYRDSESVIFAGKPGGQIVYGGWRWGGLNIPAGATIMEAYVRLRNNSWGSPLTTNLAFEKVKTPVTFSGANTPYTKWSSGQITALLPWEWTEHKEDGSAAGSACNDCWVKTPSLAGQMSEVVGLLSAGEVLREVVLLEDGTPTVGAISHGWFSYDWFDDQNGNGVQDSSEPTDPQHSARLYVKWYIDANGNGSRDTGEWYSNLLNDPDNPDYGVHVDPTTGAFSGYAWSENIGWIKFNPSTTPPGEAGSAPAILDLVTNQISGWARACAGVQNKVTCEGLEDSNAGGWDGWIKLRGQWDDGLGNLGDYGLAWDPATKMLSGYAWGGGITVGAVDFARVKVSMNVPPSATNMTATWSNYCTPQPVSGPPFQIPNPPIFLSWTFSDPNLPFDSQTNWQLQISQYPSGATYNWAAGYNIGPPPNSPVTFYFPSGAYGLEYFFSSVLGTNNYGWRVKQWDVEGAESAWFEGPTFPTARNAYPKVFFKHTPENPVVDEEIVFKDFSECYYSAHANSVNVPYPCATGDTNRDGVVSPGEVLHRYRWDFDGNGTIDCDSDPDNNGTTDNPECHPFTATPDGDVVLHTYDAVTLAPINVSLEIDTRIDNGLGSGATAKCVNNLPSPFDVSYPLPDWKETHPNP